MADKVTPGMEFASWTSLPPGILSETLSKLKGPLLGMALNSMGVGVDSNPSEGIAPPPVVDMQPTAPVTPPTGVVPVMPQLQNTQSPMTQPNSFDQARELLKQQIKQSLGMK
jgi:hypothetical protein